MQPKEIKKTFTTPSCEVAYFSVEDILATSEPKDWSGGEVSPWVIEKP